MRKKDSKYKKLENTVINNISIHKVYSSPKHREFVADCTCHCGFTFTTRAYSFNPKKNIKSCGCLAVKAGADAVRGKPAFNRLPDFQADKNDLYKRYKFRAKKRNLFLISVWIVFVNY